MTATVRGGDRTTADLYPTPPWTVRALLRAVELPGGAWLEPAAGDGAIIRSVPRADVAWDAVELREACRPALAPNVKRLRIGDFLATTILGRYDVVVTNPPFSHAQAFVEKSLGCGRWVVMLLRLGFCASKGRFPLMSRTAPDVYVLPDRPQFAGTNRDSADYAWFVWPTETPRRQGTFRVLDPTPAAERRPFVLGPT